MNPIEAFQKEVAENIEHLGQDKDLKRLSRHWVEKSAAHKWTYNFSWLGRPIIQFPTDMVAMQEIIWRTRPDLIIETGIAHGGSLIFSASMLALLDLCEGRSSDSARQVLAVDVDIREHNRTEIEKHPLSNRISMIEGSSVDGEIIKHIQDESKGHERVLVCLDSNHTHDHVLAELEAYAPLVTPESYCVVFDTIIKDMPDEMFPDRPWGVDNNPGTAVRTFLETHPEFVVDSAIDDKLQLSVAPGGYLRRTSSGRNGKSAAK